MHVLRTRGVQPEAHLPFAGLHQLLQPLLGELAQLPPPQRAALEAAFGLTNASAPDPFLIALATLDLLGEAAETTPLLLMAEDAHWLDRPTAGALAFVARRLAYDPIVLVLGIRDDVESPFETAYLPALHLEPLDLETAGELLDLNAPDLAPVVRARLLDEAGGNPLALVELPAALGADLSTAAPLFPSGCRSARAWSARSPLASVTSRSPRAGCCSSPLSTTAVCSPRCSRPLAQRPTTSNLQLPCRHCSARPSSQAIPRAGFATSSTPRRWPAKVNAKNAKKYGKSKAVTEYKACPGRSHFTMIQEGWEELADHALTWAVEHATAERPVAQRAPERTAVASGGGA
jgi:hypothetical protein